MKYCDSRSAGSVVDPRVGLCETCRWRRRVPNTRGSVFWLCRRSEVDPAWPRYPRLPVLECAGHEPGDPDELDVSGGPGPPDR